MPFVLALDQGTTSSRAIVFDEDSRIVACAQAEFEQFFPRPGWVEHDPDLIWNSQLTVALQVLAETGLNHRDIVSVGIANQRETTLLWDRTTGEPIHNAIVWQDRRTAAMCAALEADGCEPLIQQKTGLVIDPYFCAPKIAWLLENIDGARKRANRAELAFGTVDSWLIWKLTGGRLHVTDATNAARTMLYNIHEHAWDPQLLELFEIPSELLPEVRSCSELYAQISLPQLTGMAIAGVAGDQQAALFGQTCFDAGMSKNTYGTGCFALMNTGESVPTSKNRLLATTAWRIGDRTDYALEGGVFTGGAIVQWLRDGLGLIEAAHEIEALAATVQDNGGVYFVPALTGLGAPHWDPGARGHMIGITRGVTKGHIARAALEGIAFQVADVMAAMEQDSGLEMSELRVDGGAAANDLLLQFQADILGKPVLVPTVTEATALGAAYLAGLATGFWKKQDDLRTRTAIDRRFEPRMSRDEAHALKERWAQAVHRGKAWHVDS